MMRVSGDLHPLSAFRSGLEFRIAREGLVCLLFSSFCLEALLPCGIQGVRSQRDVREYNPRTLRQTTKTTIVDCFMIEVGTCVVQKTRAVSTTPVCPSTLSARTVELRVTPSAPAAAKQHTHPA